MSDSDKCGYRRKKPSKEEGRRYSFMRILKEGLREETIFEQDLSEERREPGGYHVESIFGSENSSCQGPGVEE